MSAGRTRQTKQHGRQVARDIEYRVASRDNTGSFHQSGSTNNPTRNPGQGTALAFGFPFLAPQQATRSIVTCDAQ
jgi:hypothetical protein